MICLEMLLSAQNTSPKNSQTRQRSITQHKFVLVIFSVRVICYSGDTQWLRKRFHFDSSPQYQQLTELIQIENESAAIASENYAGDEF